MKFKIGDMIVVKNNSIEMWDRFVPGCDFDKNREKAIGKIGIIKRIHKSYNDETVYCVKIPDIYHHVAYVDKCIEMFDLQLHQMIELENSL